MNTQTIIIERDGKFVRLSHEEFEDIRKVVEKNIWKVQQFEFSSSYIKKYPNPKEV